MLLLRTLRASLGRAASAGLLVTLASCSSIDVGEPVGTLDTATYRTWAWSVHVPEEEPLDSEIRGAVEAELGELGLERVAASEASFLVDYWTTVERQKRNRDPYFSMYTADEVELGTITIELRDASTEEAVWTGSGRSRLRRSAVMVGPFSTGLTPTDDPRDWRAEEKVSAILRRL